MVSSFGNRDPIENAKESDRSCVFVSGNDEHANNVLPATTIVGNWVAYLKVAHNGLPWLLTIVPGSIGPTNAQLEVCKLSRYCK